MKLTAIAERSGKWWAVEVPEIDGLFTQAKRLDKVPYMVRDAAALLTGEPEDSFEIVVTVKMDGVLERAVEAAVRAAALAAESQVQASALTRHAAHTLTEEGMAVREVGTLLGLSPQRAQQLIKSDPLFSKVTGMPRAPGIISCTERSCRELTSSHWGPSERTFPKRPGWTSVPGTRLGSNVGTRRPNGPLENLNQRNRKALPRLNLLA